MYLISMRKRQLTENGGDQGQQPSGTVAAATIALAPWPGVPRRPAAGARGAAVTMPARTVPS